MAFELLRIQLTNLTKKETEFLGKVTREAHRFRGSRMAKLQKRRMQEVSLQSWQCLLSDRKLDSSRCTIECVTHNGMLDRA